MSALAATPGHSVLTTEFIAYTNAQVLLTQIESLFAVVSAVVFPRCYVRWFMIKSFGKDDWLMLLAYAFAAATFGTYVEQTKLGMGRHTVITMDQQNYSAFLRLRQVSSILAAFGVTLVKISIACFLLRLVAHRNHIYFLHGLIMFLVLVTFACVGTLVSCGPYGRVPFPPINERYFYEVVLALRPPPYGTGTAKCFTPETFTSIGLFNTAVAAIVKTEIQKVVLQDPDPFVHDRFTLWRFIELDVGIIAASLPALKPLLNWLLGAARGLTTRSARSTGAPRSRGYRKRSERPDKGIVLNEYHPSSANTIRISSRPSNGNLWTVGPGKRSNESILPLHNAGESSGDIIVTKGVHVG